MACTIILWKKKIICFLIVLRSNISFTCISWSLLQFLLLGLKSDFFFQLLSLWWLLEKYIYECFDLSTYLKKKQLYLQRIAQTSSYTMYSFLISIGRAEETYLKDHPLTRYYWGNNKRYYHRLQHSEVQLSCHSYWQK